MSSINRLPAPTFGWLGVNGVEKDISEGALPEVNIDRSGSEPVRIEVSESGSYLISTGEGGSLEVIVYVKTDSSAELRFGVSVPDNAGIKLIQVFENCGESVSRVDAKVGEGGSLELVQLYIGGKDTVSGAQISLEGRRAAFKADIGYLTHKDEKLDINLIADHYGKKTGSEINVRGVLYDNAYKTFKGTIDFKKGAVGAKGEEKEEVLLMDSQVRNKTVPLILCAEEDVEGSHGASIGRINEEHLFYMRSRGLSDEKIYELMARSKIGQVVSRIGDDETVRRIYEVIGGGEENE
ncbi:MAG: SufD family Fe-S cluster assembly protein [Ruminococcus sp.]|nr:SufD family Fe-S cluster assembly protein [Ruminococcus sp.]